MLCDLNIFLSFVARNYTYGRFCWQGYVWGTEFRSVFYMGFKQAQGGEGIGEGGC